jgi:DNA-binding transcriptional MerR regulator
MLLPSAIVAYTEGDIVTIVAEENRIRGLFERVETVEDVAATLPADDQRRASLLRTARQALEAEGAIRVVVAAAMLGVSERTVRNWVKVGLLTRAPGHATTRLVLDLVRVHDLKLLIDEIRRAGQTDRNLADAIWYRLTDNEVLAREDLRESIEQMRQGMARRVTPEYLAELAREGDD